MFVLVFGEKFVFADEAIEGGLCNLIGPEESLFNAESVDGHFVMGRVMKVGFGGIDGFEKFFGCDFSRVAFVFACLCSDPGDAVIFVTVEPGLDGSPGELPWVSLFVEECHGGNIANTFVSSSSVNGVDGAEDAHLEIDGRLFHECSPCECVKIGPG